MGITFEKLMIIAVIAVIVIGPEKLPEYAQKLGQFVKSLRRLATSAKERVRSEMGDEFNEVDWRQYDPRQYDPRKIVRDALAESAREEHLAKKLDSAGYHPAAADPRRASLSGSLIADVAAERAAVINGAELPFDSEAT